MSTRGRKTEGGTT